MSETAPEAPPRQGGGGNVLTRKLGPLPTWVWVAIVATIILAWVVIRQRGSSSTATTSGTAADASQVPQFVNQTFTTVTPPPAPDQDAPAPKPPPKPDADEEQDEREPPRRGRHKPKPKPRPKPHVPPRRTPKPRLRAA